MKYKIRDKVKIKSNLVLRKWYPMSNNAAQLACTTPCMMELCGKIVEICGDHKGYYLVKEYSRPPRWTDSMFEPVCMPDDRNGALEECAFLNFLNI